MKKAIMCIGIAAALIGCKSLPTPEKMENTAKAVGYTTGLVVKETVTKEKSIDAITNIVVIVSQCTPEKGQSFVNAWTPVAQKYVNEMVEKGKLSPMEGQLVMSGVGVVTTGMDYIFDSLYPKAREYEELVSAAIRGFTNGFMQNFDGARNLEKIEIDKDLYKMLKKKVK